MSDDIFATLKGLLTPHAPQFAVKHDAPDNYNLETETSDGKTEMFAAVQIKKSYVSLHLFAVYCDPALLTDISDALRKRMQGKSCFNFGPRHAIPVEELTALIGACAQASKAR